MPQEPVNINRFERRGERPSAVRGIPMKLTTRIEKYDAEGKILEIQEMTTSRAIEHLRKVRSSRSLEKIAAINAMEIKKIEVKKG